MVGEFQAGRHIMICGLQCCSASGGSLADEIVNTLLTRGGNVSLGIEKFEDLENEG